MTGKTHLAAGIGVGIGVIYIKKKFGLDITLANILFGLGCAVGSLLPDIDIDNSRCETNKIIESR